MRTFIQSFFWLEKRYITKRVNWLFLAESWFCGHWINWDDATDITARHQALHISGIGTVDLPQIWPVHGNCWSLRKGKEGGP